MEGFGEVAELHNVDNAGKVADLAEVAAPRNADNVGKAADLAEVAEPRNADNAGKFGKSGGLCWPHEPLQAFAGLMNLASLVDDGVCINEQPLRAP